MRGEIDAPTTVTPEPSEVIETEDPDPATARVAGVPLGETHAPVYDWLTRQFAPAAEAIDPATDGGSPRRNGLLPSEAHEELSDGIETMAASIDLTPADLLSEFAARRYTFGRSVCERSRRLDELTAAFGRTIERLTRQEERRDRAAVLVTLGDRLTATGALLYDRYGEVTPGNATADLPRRPNPQRARRVARVLAAYDHRYPSEPNGGTLAAIPTAAVDELLDARRALAFAAVTVAYARWDTNYTLRIEYPVEFARPSPETAMTRLPEYEPHGIRVDAGAFDTALADRITRLRDGRYLDRFRRAGHVYVAALCRLAGRDPPEDASLAEAVRAVETDLPKTLGG